MTNLTANIGLGPARIIRRLSINTVRNIKVTIDITVKAMSRKTLTWDGIVGTKGYVSNIWQHHIGLPIG